MVEVDTINIKELKPSQYNPRQMTEASTQKLTKNLEQFGLVDPIIINLQNNHIIGGHQRHKILSKKYDNNKELQLIRLGDIGWVFEDTHLTIPDTDHEKALNISLNSLDGEFDTDALGKLLSELDTTSIDMDLTGFDEIEVLDYTLDYDLQQLNDEAPEDNNNIHLDDLTEEYTTVIHFTSEDQRTRFMEFLMHLKEQDHSKSTSTLLLEYLQGHYQDQKNKKVHDYHLLFDTEKDYQKFQVLYKKIRKQYNIDPLITFIDDQT